MPEPEPDTAIPEPICIEGARKIVAELTRLIDAGEIEELSCYLACRDGGYLNFQTHAPGHHEAAGRMLELALLRLGFLQRDVVEDMIENLE